MSGRGSYRGRGWGHPERASYSGRGSYSGQRPQSGYQGRQAQSGSAQTAVPSVAPELVSGMERMLIKGNFANSLAKKPATPGTLGNKITVVTNLFLMKKLDDSKVYQYDIKIEMKKKKSNKGVVEGGGQPKTSKKSPAKKEGEGG